MTIVLCGGGSGGHITPLLAVARELKKLQPAVRIIYVGEKNGKFSHIAEESGVFDSCKYIYAGKLRRYHGESLFTRLTDIKTLFFNVRDIFKLFAGTVQSIFLFRKLRPASVLLKGGYVCVPASIGAKLSKAVIITHDSDALPGLSNRFAAQFATYHATAMPPKYYSYPSKSVKHVGLPVNELFREYSNSEMRFLREKLKIKIESPVILITGGSNGAHRLNNWILQSLEELMHIYPELHAIIAAGKGNKKQFEKSAVYHSYKDRIILEEFTDELYHYSAVSDVIITRAGATAIAEFAAQSKACVLIPSPFLSGGHQLKNAVVYNDAGSVKVVYEKDLTHGVKLLTTAIQGLLDNKSDRTELGRRLHATLPIKPASKSLAELLLKGVR